MPASIINMISGHVSIRFGFRAEPRDRHRLHHRPALHRRGRALIEHGDADVMVAGGAESTVSPLGIGGFAARGPCRPATTTRTASRPWDKDRDGFVLGEAPAWSVLEE